MGTESLVQCVLSLSREFDIPQAWLLGARGSASTLPDHEVYDDVLRPKQHSPLQESESARAPVAGGRRLAKAAKFCHLSRARSLIIVCNSSWSAASSVFPRVPQKHFKKATRHERINVSTWQADCQKWWVARGSAVALGPVGPDLPGFELVVQCCLHLEKPGRLCFAFCFCQYLAALHRLWLLAFALFFSFCFAYCLAVLFLFLFVSPMALWPFI